MKKQDFLCFLLNSRTFSRQLVTKPVTSNFIEILSLIVGGGTMENISSSKKKKETRKKKEKTAPLPRSLQSKNYVRL